MYESWARLRGMRWAALGTGIVAPDGVSFAVSGFAAYALLAPEDGLHVLDRETPRGTRRDTVRVRVAVQPPVLVRDAVRGWRTGRIERVLAGEFDVIPAGEK